MNDELSIPHPLAFDNSSEGREALGRAFLSYLQAETARRCGVPSWEQVPKNAKDYAKWWWLGWRDPIPEKGAAVFLHEAMRLAVEQSFEESARHYSKWFLLAFLEHRGAATAELPEVANQWRSVIANAKRRQQAYDEEERIVEAAMQILTRWEGRRISANQLAMKVVDHLGMDRRKVQKVRKLLTRGPW